MKEEKITKYQLKIIMRVKKFQMKMKKKKEFN